MKLRYFRSVEIPDELEDVFKALEDILQQEHGIDGAHRIASASQAGMMSAEDKIKLDKLSSGTVSEESSTIIVNNTGGTPTGGTGETSNIFNFQQKLYIEVDNVSGVTFTFSVPYAGINLYTCHIACTKGDGGSFRSVGYKRTKTPTAVTVIPVESGATVKIVCYAIPT